MLSAFSGPCSGLRPIACILSALIVIVTNHCSNLDPLMMGWASGHQIGRIVHFMAKIEMRGWPVIGWLAEAFGAPEAVRMWLNRPLYELESDSPLAVMLAGEAGAVETLLANARSGIPG